MGGVYVFVQNVQALCSVQPLRSVPIAGLGKRRIERFERFESLQNSLVQKQKKENL
jgi:hypothetical protein